MNKERIEELNEKYTVIFLISEEDPRRVLMLKRAAWKKFAPSMFTGVGGKVEEESPYDGALRELTEETGIVGLELVPFAVCAVPNIDRAIYYYWARAGEWQNKIIECNEGDLAWVAVHDLFDLEIIPTTKLVMEEWVKRGLVEGEAFTLYADVELDETGNDIGRRLDRIEEGI